MEMDQKHARHGPGARIELIDLARGAALAAMAVYHFTWDMEFFSYVQAGTTAVGGWKIFARCIASSFLFLVGVSLFLAHRDGVRWPGFWRRLAMVGAAKADGHIDANEQKRLFAEVERLGLDAEAKAYIFDLLTQDVDLYDLARSATTPEQGAEIYLAARLAIDPDQPSERAYLDALATRLGLPADLRAQLDGARQA